MKKQRGRPRLYDAEEALQAAGAVFWARGFSATSLDDLSAAMGMNRPSIYRAFGDKEAIYRQALAQFSALMETGFDRTLGREADFVKGLSRFYREALDVYTAGDDNLGCLVMCTAPAAAASHPEVRSDLRSVIRKVDAKLLKRIEQAIEQGEIRETVDASSLSKVLQAVLHSLAIRARAGESKASLRKFIEGAVETLLGRAL